MIRWIVFIAALAAMPFVGRTVRAQMIQSTVPAGQVRSGFFEQSAFSWSLRGDQFFAQSGAPARVPFGNPDANAGLRGGVATTGGGVSGSLGFSFAQGSSRSISSSSASVTTLDGHPGAIASQTIRPFVTGVTPIVGGYGNPVRDNAASQMQQAYQQRYSQQWQQRVLAAAKAKQVKAKEAFDRGVRAEQEVNLRQARANYRRALGLDQGPLRQQILLRLQRF